MFAPHPNLSDEVNRNIVQSEIEGGVFLEGLPPDTVLQIRTQNHFYTALFLGEGAALISGHPQYCPEPVQVTIAGSTWGGSMLKLRFIGRVCTWSFIIPPTAPRLSPLPSRKSASASSPPANAAAALAWSKVVEQPPIHLKIDL